MKTWLQRFTSRHTNKFVFIEDQKDDQYSWSEEGRHWQKMKLHRKADPIQTLLTLADNQSLL